MYVYHHVRLRLYIYTWLLALFKSPSRPLRFCEVPPEFPAVGSESRRRPTAIGMGSTFNPQPYQSVRGPSDVFTVKQLPFVTVMRRPSTASSAHSAHIQRDAACHPERAASTLSSRTGPAPHAAAFSPKWTADKLRSTTLSAQPAQLLLKQRAVSAALADGNVERHERTGRGKNAARGDVQAAEQRERARGLPAEAAVFEDNHVLRAAVSALQAMIDHERRLQQDADAQVGDAVFFVFASLALVFMFSCSA